jgi:hypothetical protein
VYAAVHFGGLEVFGATREAEPGRDADELLALAHAVLNGERVTTVLRRIAEGFGPHEFGLDSALPDAADQIVQGAADQLVDRITATYEHLYKDTRPLVGSLLTAGYPLPRELRAAAEFALARRFEAEIAAADGSTVESYRAAQAIVAEAREAGLQLVTPRAVALMGRSLLSAVDRALEAPHDEDCVESALAVLRLARELDLHLALDLERAQERVFEARRDRPDDEGLARLAAALGLMV